jgi:hypothetical protein
MAFMNSDILDPDLIAPSLPSSNIEVKKTFEIPEDHYNPKGLKPPEQTVSDGPLGDQIPGMLPKVDIDFKILDDGKTKIVTFQEIESMLMKNQSISQEEAKLIDQKMPGFLSSEKELSRFTKAPSSVRLEHSLRYIRQCIATEEDNLYKTIGQTVFSYYQKQSEQLNDFIENQRSSLLYSVDEFVQELYGVYEKIKVSPNLQVALQDDTFVNLLTSPLSVLKTARLSEDTVNSNPAYKKAFDVLLSLTDIIEKAGLYALIYRAKQDPSQIQWFFKADIAEFESSLQELTLQDVLDCVFTNTFKSVLENLYTSYSQYVQSQQETIRVLSDLPNQDSASVSFWYADHEKDIKQLLTVMHRLNAISVICPAFLLSIKSFFDLFVSL